MAEALTAALEALHPRAASFDSSAAASSASSAVSGGGGSALARLRRALAAAHEKCEEWGAAARALAGIDVETIGALAASAAAAAAAASTSAAPDDGKGGGGAATTAPAAAARPSLAPAIAEKLSHCVRVAMLYLEDEDAESAESFVRKAAPLAAALASAGADAKASSSSSSSSPSSFSAAAALADLGLELQYRSCSARVLDARRDFTRAAAAYSALSRAREPGSVGGERGAPPELVSDEELDAALSAAVTCAVLAPPSPARTRVLASLWRDANGNGNRSGAGRTGGRARERLPASLLGVLRSVRSERLLTRDDARALDAALTMPHHRAVGGDGATVLERALREHNLAAAARVYSALTLQSLGELLGLGGGGAGGGGGGDGAATKEKSTSSSSSSSAARLAEAMAAKMVAEGRLRATIDQVDGIITFEESGDGGGVGGGKGGAGAGALAAGGGGGGDGGGEAGDEDDEAIAALCEGLDAVAAAVAV